ncbi:MAG: hypothetical protein HY675_17860 [Chloroflexi bacterium]|nr:hypothetical protein [Chloroflexota bacterium]
MDLSALYRQPSTWEKLLEIRHNGFVDLKEGSRIGVLPKSDVSELNGEMIVWEVGDQGIVVSTSPFRGFRGAGVDLLFVAEEDTLAVLCDGGPREPVAAIKNGLRQGRIILYFLRSKKELLALGYEELVESLGLPLSGCQ